MDIRKIMIFDTTLRDGEQSPGCSMNTNEKLEVAAALESMGVDIIEAGFAASSEDDFVSVREISSAVKKCTVASLSRLLEKDILASAEALKNAVHPRIHTFIATSDIHMHDKLHMTSDEVLTNVEKYVRYAKSLCDDVEFSAEDATRSDLGFLCEVMSAAVNAGASILNLPDTVGYRTPTEIFGMYTQILKKLKLPPDITIAAHCHNDLGLATANSLAAVAAGASQIDCTLCGIGERAGNASLEEVVMALKTRKDFYSAETSINTKKIFSACRLVSSITGTVLSPNKPIIGSNAFSHEAGIHQHGIMSNRATYEIMSPDDIGIPSNRIILGKHSGRHAFEEKLRELDIALSENEFNEAFELFKAVAEKKKAVTDKDIHAITSEKVRKPSDGFRLIRFIVNSGNTIPSMAVMKLARGVEMKEDSATGAGPIDAAFKAIDRIIRHTQGAENIKYNVEDYKINSVSEGGDALGEVVVKISSGDEIYAGRGLSTDIIEASIKAYLNAINKILVI